MKRSISTLTYLLIVISISAGIAAAQTTEFAYQGNLQNGGTAANGNYDLEFKLYDAASVGGQIGVTASRSNVAVNSGTFAVTLDFGAGSFPGPDRWIEIAIRPAGSGGGFQQLLPRTKLSSSPYAIQSLNAATAINATTAATATNATQLGGVAANQYVVTTDPRMTDARPPTAGSSNYIQNQNAGAQAASNFNISGTGTANIFNAAIQYDLGGTRVLSVAGDDNVFVGAAKKVPGVNNTGRSNSFVGKNAGIYNETGSGNSFFGRSAGLTNVSGQSNSFFGFYAGRDNTSGFGNTFLGQYAGRSSSTGNNNTAIGFEAEFIGGNLSFATAIGSKAIGSNSNSVVLGRPGGEDTVRIPGNLNVTGSASLNGNLIVASGAVVVYNTPILLSATGLGSAGSASLCRNAANQISSCSSSLRYKTNINRFGLGLNLVNQLKPITFDWKEGGMHDLGLGAEDVAAIEPLLVTYNSKGEVEGVKYDRIGVVLVNAVKEQQAQLELQNTAIESLRKSETEARRAAAEMANELKELQRKLDAMTALLCKAGQGNEQICGSIGENK